MYDIQLKKGGKLVSRLYSMKNTLEGEVNSQDLNFHISDTIDLESGVKLRDVFLLFSKNMELFGSLSGCPFIEDVIDEALKPVSKSPIIDKGLSALVVKWVVHDDCEGIGMYPTLSGMGLEKDFSLMSLPINEISFLPLVLDISFDVFRKEKVVFSTKKPFTLLDISKAILDELASWPPDMRDLIDEDFNEVAPEKIKAIIETKKPCKKCGGDAREHVFGKPKNICSKCFQSSKEN